MCVIPSFCLSEVYRWVDGNGRVHFSDNAPQSQAAEVVQLSNDGSESTLGAQAGTIADQLQRQKHLSQVLEEERLAKDAQRKDKAAKALQQDRYCERFKNRLAYLDSAGLIYDENDDGTRVYLSDEEGDRYRAEMKARYRQDCGHS